MGERVLLFLPNLSGGGAERVIVQLANEFVLLGIDTHLAIADSSNMDYEDELSSEVTCHVFGYRRVLQAVPRLSALFSTLKPDMALTTMGHAAVACFFALNLSGQRRNVRFFVREAISIEYKLNQLIGFRGRVIHYVVKKVYQRADAIIAPSTVLMKELVSHYKLRNRTAVIANPVLVDSFLHQLAEEPELPLPWGSETRVFVSMGRLNPQKDFTSLIKGFATLATNWDCKLVILGDGPQRAELESLIRRLNIEQQCWLPGFVKNPLPYLKRAQVFVLSSRFEGLPNALIQAYAAGCNCVATNCPTGPAEILENGKFGRLVPVGDVEALSMAMQDSMDEAIVRQGESRRTQYELFKHRYDSAQVATDFLSLMHKPG